MLPPLTRSNLPIPRGQTEWPERPTREHQLTGALFESRTQLRLLTALIDADLLASPGAAFGQDVVLTGLLAHPYVKFLRYRDKGPSSDVQRRESGVTGSSQTIAEGWAELLPPSGRDGRRNVIYAFPGTEGYVLTGVLGNQPNMARRDTTSAAYSHLNQEGAADQRELDALAVQVAESVQADLFITDRPYLFQKNIAQGVTVCRPSDALALIGLYLRSQNEFIICQTAECSEAIYMNKGLYYWVGTRELLPTAWRWFTACVQESTALQDNTLLDLGQSLLRRVQRALRERDRFHQMFNLPQNNDTALDVLEELDSILVSLMGAVDVSARVAHIVLSLPGNTYNVGWQKQGWLTQVSAAEPTLGALFNTGTSFDHVLTILRLLRNTVHGQMMRLITIRQPGAHETVIQLPTNDEAVILTAMDATGGRSAWGVSPMAGNRSLASPGLFVEQLFPCVLELLNEAMRNTPIERLTHVHLTAADNQPPQDPPERPWDNVFGETNRQNIRWQLGF